MFNYSLSIISIIIITRSIVCYADPVIRRAMEESGIVPEVLDVAPENLVKVWRQSGTIIETLV